MKTHRQRKRFLKDQKIAFFPFEIFKRGIIISYGTRKKRASLAQKMQRRRAGVVFASRQENKNSELYFPADIKAKY